MLVQNTLNGLVSELCWNNKHVLPLKHLLNTPAPFLPSIVHKYCLADTRVKKIWFYSLICHMIIIMRSNTAGSFSPWSLQQLDSWMSMNVLGQGDARVTVQVVRCGPGLTPPVTVRPGESPHPHNQQRGTEEEIGCSTSSLSLQRWGCFCTFSSHQNPSTPPNLKNTDHKQIHLKRLRKCMQNALNVNMYYPTLLNNTVAMGE